MARENTKSNLLFEQLSREILERSYRPGDKLPSLRVLAEKEGVSKSTAVEVYERLSAIGLVEPMPGRGFFVHQRNGEAEKPPALDVFTTLPSVSERDWLRGGGVQGLLASGAVNPDLLDAGLIRTSMRAVASRSPEHLLSYGELQGYQPLRAAISERLRKLKIEVDDQRIMITDSASHAIDLVCRAMLSSTDTILVDDPTSFEFNAFPQLYGVRVVGLPIRNGERDLDALASILENEKPKIYLTNTVLQNPTGITISSKAAFEMLSLLKAYDVTVIEDDVYSDFDTEAAVRLASLSQFKNVLYIGSFSKTMSGSLRSGFVAASAERIRAFLEITDSSTFGASSISAKIVHEALTSGKHRRSMISLREKVTKLRNSALIGLSEMGFEIAPPPGGIFLWAKCPSGVDASAAAIKASERSLLLAPGPLFSPSGKFHRYLRFNCTYMNDNAVFEKIRDAVS